ncbi:hypothetical protein F2Q69_00020285 [Brassica cretica]|uniref:Uncharacterized protein n=1 Tax=Brassica cretica TaxID=69181 RepID=A0A8S9QA30_BRACR|nr:hypothetical protein F2Q69_00020285 [Brassica cretica]
MAVEDGANGEARSVWRELLRKLNFSLSREMSLTGKHELGYRFTCRDDKMYGCYDDQALKEATSKLKQADKLARAKDVAIDRKTKEFKATIDKVAEDRAQLIERKKAQKAHFLEKFGELKDKFEAAGDHANEGSVEPTGRELGELPLQEGGIAGEVVRLEDTTVASALDPTTLSTSLVVNEDPLVPVLGTSVETETEPVNLLELSDSSTEEEGGKQLEETESGLVGNPQNEEGAVDGTDNLPVLPADVTGEASDRLTAQPSEAFVDVISGFILLLRLSVVSDFHSSQGDHANEGSVEPTGRELGELPLQEGGIVGEVVRLEDTTIASASDPTTLSTSLVVNEDPLVPVLRTSVETETEPVNLLELSDSSTEEEGGEQLEETESGLVGNPQNEEGAVDGTDNLPVLPTDVTGEASDRLTAQVIEGGSDRVED